MPNILKKRDESLFAKWNQGLDPCNSAHQTAPLPQHYTDFNKHWDFQVKRFTFCLKGKKIQKRSFNVFVKPMVSCLFMSDYEY